MKPNTLSALVLTLFIALAGVAQADHHHKQDDRKTLNISADGVSDEVAPEVYSFSSTVTAKCYADVEKALDAHAQLSNTLQGALKGLDEAKDVFSTTPTVRVHSERDEQGKPTKCENAYSVSQNVTLITKKLESREAITTALKKVYVTLAGVIKKEGVRGGLGEPSVVASLPQAAVPGLTATTSAKLLDQAVNRAAANLEAQKKKIGGACGLVNVDKHGDMQWSLGNQHFAGAAPEAAMAFRAADVASTNPSGLSIRVNVSATYKHGGVCSADEAEKAEKQQQQKKQQEQQQKQQTPKQK